jgi:hypothetical protein
MRSDSETSTTYELRAQPGTALATVRRKPGTIDVDQHEEAAMKGKRWGAQEKPGKGWAGRPKRVRMTGGMRPTVVRKTAA